jgi:hypothetical protein
VHYYLPLGVSSEKLSFGVEVSSALVVLLLLGVSDFFREVFLFRELCISFITFKKKCISFISALALVIMSHYKEKKRLHQLNSEYKFPRKHSISTRLPPLKIAERKKSWALEIPPGKVSFDQVTTYITWSAVVTPRDGEGSWRPVPGSAGERQKTRDAIAQALSSVCAACTGEMGSCCE